MKSLNLGILAHVDAGKTSLTERLLFEAGVLDEVGSVDVGTTQTDTLALERERGITIRSAVVSFAIDDVTVNLIDTPGHSDFIAEVERVLSVLDGAVLIVSAVEGVQAQTRILMRALQRLQIPTLIFVNKVDRSGAAPERVLTEISERLTGSAVAMTSACRQGTREAYVEPYDYGDAEFADRLAGVLAERDDALLGAWVDGTITGDDLRDALAAKTRRAHAHPVYFGSAATGAGVDALRTGIGGLLPAAVKDPDGPLSASVFKVERGDAGEKIAYVGVDSGTIRVRDRLRLREAEADKVTAIGVFDTGAAERRDSVTAGRVAKVWGLSGVRIGDVIGERRDKATPYHFTPPTLETIVDPLHPEDRGAMHTALTRLAEQDPLIDLRQDEVHREVSVSLYGEVQKQVIEAMLAQQYNVDVTFRETTTLCVESVLGSGHAYEVIDTDTNPFLATVGLRVDPAPPGSGISFGLEVELGSMPSSFFTAVEFAVRQTLRQGPAAWEVIDCSVTMTHSGYWARQSHAHGSFDASMSSTAGDFRKLTPLVLMSALRRAGTQVLEPVNRFELEIPADQLGPVLAALPPVEAVPLDTRVQGRSYVLVGEVPAARANDLQQLVPPLTRGEGVLVGSFERYRPVRGTAPTRSRTDDNPLDRSEYLLRVAR